MATLGTFRAHGVLARTPAFSLYITTPIRSNLAAHRVQAKSFHSKARMSSNTPSSTIPHISLHIAASSSGKGRKYRPELSTFDYNRSISLAMGIQVGDTIHQRRAQRPDSGQDAYFVSQVGENSDVIAFGIADGVGGWTDHGIDPADFSHGLCSHMAKIALSWSGDKLGPKNLLDLGYQATARDPDIKAGGSTACVAVTDPDGRMRIANLGDSGFLQLRLGTVHHYSNPQTHAFNTPFQMSLTPPDILAQARIFGGIPLNDQPDRADLADHMLRHGDVLVLATDGVWDNLNSQDVLGLVSTIMRACGAWKRTPDQGYIVTDKLAGMTEPGRGPEFQLPGTLQAVLAAAIAGEAKNASMNQKRDGPFAKAMQKEYPFDPYHGGKVDDISVLVVIPVDESKAKKPLQAKL